MKEEKEYAAAHGFTAHTPDANEYHNPSDLRLTIMQGRSAADMLPPRHGLKGIVIPRATVAGGSRGKKYLKVTEVQIDPHVPGEDPLRIDFSKIDPDKLEEAFASAEGDDIRNIAYNTFKKLAGKEGTYSADLGEMDYPITREHLPNAYMIPRVVPVLENRTQESESKVASFTSQPKVEIAPTEISMPEVKAVPPSVKLAGAMMRPQQTQSETIIPPMYKVTFELDGFGTFETSYHRVIKGDDGISLILVYDNSHQGGLKYFPQATDADMYVDVHDMPEVFKVKSTGMKYTIDNFEHCILLIETAVLKEGE